MSRTFRRLVLLSFLGFAGCGVYREAVKLETVSLVGLEGLHTICLSADTVRTVIIRKAEALFKTADERYEAQVTIYAVKDSMIYMSAVNSGFEVLRAAVDRDSIKVIDRLNKVVYSTPVERRFGYHHPVVFRDIENLISGYFLCDELDRAEEHDFFHIVFDFDDALIKKHISYGRESLRMDKFEFYHTMTDKFLMGEKTEEGLKIYSNFIINDLEVTANGGEISYNQHVNVKMDVNRRRYSFVNL